MNSKVLNDRTESAGCTVAADHGNRARTQSDQRIDAENAGNAYSQNVLQDDEKDDLDQENDQVLAAFLEDGQIRLESYGSKEKYHADLAECVVIDKFHNAAHVENTGEDRDNKSSDDGRGDTESFQEADPLSEEPAQHQNADCDRKRKIFVDFDSEH